MPVKCKTKRGKRRKGFGRSERRPTGLAARLRRKRLKKAAVTLPKGIRLSPLLMPSQQFDRLSPSWGVWEEDRDLHFWKRGFQEGRIKKGGWEEHLLLC